jgi:hypothetical protein
MGNAGQDQTIIWKKNTQELATRSGPVYFQKASRGGNPGSYPAEEPVSHGLEKILEGNSYTANQNQAPGRLVSSSRKAGIFPALLFYVMKFSQQNFQAAV